jgi:Leu/Phe-tRNA-protein transferase
VRWPRTFTGSVSTLNDPAHSIEVWLSDTLVGGAIGIGIGDVISGDSLFGRHHGAARVAVADVAARLEEARRLPGPG